MALGGAIRAGAAYVELVANDNKLVRGFNRASKKLKAFSAQARAIGKGTIGLSAAFATPLVAGGKVFADFEQQMANVSTMLQNPEVHLKTFREEIRNMSEEFGESTEALANGLYDILSASVPAEKALDVLAVSAKAAKAGLTDTGTAADAITTVLNSYGFGAENAADVSDLLFSIVQKGKTTFAELAPNIGKVATIASTAGVSLEELGAAIATMTRSGIKTEDSMTAVNAVISSFLKPSDEASKLARELGFEMNAATLRSEGLIGIFNRIKKLPPDMIAKLFPNVRAIKGVLPALQNLEGFSGDLETMTNRVGATDTAYKKMTNTLVHAGNQIKQAFLATLSVIGEQLADSIKSVMARIKKYLGLVRKIISENKGWVITISKFVIALGLLGAAIFAVGSAGAVMAFVFGGIASIVTGVGTVIGFLGTILAGLLSPIGAVITGLVVLGVYLVRTTDTGKKVLKELGDKFNALKERAAKAWQGIGDALASGDIGLAARILWLTLKQEWLRGVNALKEAWINFKDFFMTIGTNAFWGLVAVLAESWAFMQNAWVSTVGFLSDIWLGFTTGIERGWNATQGFLAKGWAELMGLFDESMEVEAVKASIDRETEKENNKLLEEAGKKLAEREEKRKQEKARIEDERVGTLDEIGKAANEENKQRRDQYAKDLQNSEAELNEARKEWKEAIAKAAANRPDEQDDDIVSIDYSKKAKKKLKDAEKGIKDATSRTIDLDVKGTFNAEAARGLGAGDATEERTAKATEETAKNTKKLLQEAISSGLAFS